MDQSTVIVIGAGVIGLSAAIAAQAKGFDVTVIDKVGPAGGASAGNAGAFAFTDILPLASPGILRKAPGWLFDPLGPLSIPPSYALNIAPWMLRFWRACNSKQFARSAGAQASLMDLSKARLESFLSMTGTLSMLRRDGNLQVYESATEFRNSLAGWKARQKHGIEFRHLDAREMADLQPGISARFTCGTFTPEWYSIADPKLYTLALAEFFRKRGGIIETAEATALRPSEDSVEVITKDGARVQAARVVLSAGAFSHRISKTLGDLIPLETERGYNTTLPSNAFDLRTQITFGGHGFVVTRLSTGIRIGGAVELGGLELPPRFSRSNAMLQKAKAFLPGLDTAGGSQWMGFRPSLPDSLPIIGRASSTPRVIYAFGHGHLGLTQSVGTAALVTELLLNLPASISIEPFHSERFS